MKIEKKARKKQSHRIVQCNTKKKPHCILECNTSTASNPTEAYPGESQRSRQWRRRRQPCVFVKSTGIPRYLTASRSQVLFDSVLRGISDGDVFFNDWVSVSILQACNGHQNKQSDQDLYISAQPPREHRVVELGCPKDNREEYKTGRFFRSGVNGEKNSDTKLTTSAK